MLIKGALLEVMKEEGGKEAGLILVSSLLIERSKKHFG
jgi:hypothetical protein